MKNTRLLAAVVGIVLVLPACQMNSPSPARRCQSDSIRVVEPLRQGQYEAYRTKSSLTEQDVKLLISALEQSSPSERIRHDGPITERTTVTDILISHGNTVRSSLLVALRSDDPNVRRYAAFCLGYIGGPNVTTALQSAISAEIQRAEGTEFSVIGTDRKSYYFAALHAMAEAYFRLDGSSAADWLMSRFVDSERDFANFAINVTLERLFPLSTVTAGASAQVWWSDELQPAWIEWYTRIRASENAVRRSICPATRAAVALVASPAGRNATVRAGQRSRRRLSPGASGSLSWSARSDRPTRGGDCIARRGLMPMALS